MLCYPLTNGNYFKQFTLKVLYSADIIVFNDSNFKNNFEYRNEQIKASHQLFPQVFAVRRRTSLRHTLDSSAIIPIIAICNYEGHQEEEPVPDIVQRSGPSRTQLCHQAVNWPVPGKKLNQPGRSEDTDQLKSDQCRLRWRIASHHDHRFTQQRR